ncbi:hypothetical protein ACWE42_17540 [Sutcliffiella cohnii]|uniref:Uncharacterized protein n=1 Tax=Sutcliffiella cohnii TaxID=33932 RepID=A0A223KU91_9BACI|nr:MULTISPECIES: hypothetical protein [Sutcliffiella]AST93061.1 hypothetical protein BC6307_18255 [Sutcliffiella cohnii]MED4016767.1 hypothetical protein [Sutcliffiella cohnii]WBL14264.1 hypothetical protein O1A01_20635 [Sutcliffiella sp. NC1]
MDYHEPIHEIRKAVEEAWEAVYHTQTNNNSRNYQQSIQLIAYAKELLHSFHGKELSQEDETNLLRAKELLRQVEETQEALTLRY